MVEGARDGRRRQRQIRRGWVHKRPIGHVGAASRKVWLSEEMKFIKDEMEGWLVY
jgi:hypothetical protein